MNVETTKISKAQLIKDFQHSENDTGSTSVQVALLTQTIEKLKPHFAKHQKDIASKRGFLQQIANRTKLLKYLKSTNYDQYTGLIKQLGLRK